MAVTTDPLFFRASAIEAAVSSTASRNYRNFGLSVQRIDFVRPVGLGKSWMALLAADVPISRDQHRNVQRFIVDSALRTEALDV